MKNSVNKNLVPGSGEAKKSDKADYLSVLKESLKTSVFYIFLFSAAINILMLMLPIYSLQVFDRVLSSGSIPTLTALSLIAFFSFALYSIFNSVREFILIKLSSWLDGKLNERVFKLSVNHSSLTGQRMNAQFLNEAAAVKNFVSSPQIFAIFDLPWSFVFILVIFLISPQISLLVIFGSIILFALTYFKEFKTKPFIKEANEIGQQNNKRADELIRHSEVIEAMGMYPNTYKIWMDEHSNLLEQTKEVSYFSSKLSSVSKMIRMTLQIALIGYGTYLALNKEMTFGGIIACSILAGKALAPFDQIMGVWSSFGNFRESYNKLKSFLNNAAERPLSTNLGKPRGEVSTEKLVFINPKSQKPIIKNIDIKIEAGDIVGIIGPSGSGKSTLIKLLSGVYKPTSGVVRIDGGDAFQRNREDIGRYIGYLPQSIDILRGTVKQNISRFDPNSKDDEVIIAAKKAGVHELILGLPQGYDTAIGEGNFELSGGQKQRVALARAFYGDPSIIFLDEPNANLDGDGERILLRSIENARNEGRTVIMICHKPSVTSITNKMMVIFNGELKDFGPREEMMKKYVSKV
jgi:PrtD family type I secretion system ABC transporter